MEKKDYYSLQSKYSFLQDYLKRYRKDLKDFIDEAFEKHGSEFVLKPEDCDTWKEADEIDQGLDAMGRIPTFLFIDSKNRSEREIYPTKIYRRNGSDTHYVNGYDYDDCEFVNGLRANDDTDSLESIAEFINAVLEQEQNWLKVGSKVKWNDPGIDDYDEECRETVRNRVFTIKEINGDVILIRCDGTEAEVPVHELDPVD